MCQWLSANLIAGSWLAYVCSKTRCKAKSSLAKRILSSTEIVADQERKYENVPHRKVFCIRESQNKWHD